MEKPKTPPGAPLSPFAPAPSAPPPSSHVRSGQVRVPAPGANVAALPFSPLATPDVLPLMQVSVEDDAPPSARAATVLPPRQSPPIREVDAAPPSASASARWRLDPTVQTRAVKPTTSRFWLTLVGAAALVGFIVFVFALWRVFGRPSAAPRAAAFSFESPSSTPSTAASLLSGGAASSAASVVVPVETAPAAAPASPAPQPFDREAARATLEALAPKLADCKLPKGRPVRVRVALSPDGSVASVTALAPVVGRQAACIVGHVKEARVEPFQGPAVPAVYTIVPR